MTTTNHTQQLNSVSVSPRVIDENECRENTEHEHQDYVLHRILDREGEEAEEEVRRANKRAFVAEQTAHLSLEEKLKWLDEYDIDRKLRDEDEMFANWDSPFYQTKTDTRHSRMRQWYDSHKSAVSK